MGTEPPAPDAALRGDYARQRHELLLRRTKIALVLVLAIVPSAVVLDAIVYPERVALFLWLRAICTAAAACLFALARTRLGPRYPRFLGVAWVVLAAGYVDVMILVTEGAASPYYQGVLLAFVGACLMLPWSVPECAVASAAVGSMYGVACVGNALLYGLPGDAWGLAFNNAFFVFLWLAIALICTYYLDQFRFQEFSLRQELARSRAQLEDSYSKLEQLDRAKSRFFASISHELRTPIALILSPLEALRRGGGPGAKERLAEYLDLMHANAMRLLSLINDLLDLIRLEEGRLQTGQEPVDLRDLLPGLAAAVKGMADTSRVSLHLELDESGNLVAEGDRGHLEKIFLNLLFNAVKFTPAGGDIRIRASEEGDRVVASVSDTGVGIPKEKIGRVFERFWQDEPARARVRRGTGIGLALVRELVELQKGTVEVVSEEGKGSTFTVRLPKSLHQPEARPADTGDGDWLADVFRRARWYREGTTSTQQEPSAASAHGLQTVLVVEDEPDMQRFLRSELAGSFKVVTAIDGPSGLAAALESRPDVVLTDHALPGFDGVTLCRKLRSSLQGSRPKVIILTAHVEEAVKLEALEAGADDFITKPFNSLELKTRLANLAASALLEKEIADQNQVLQSTIRRLREAEAQLLQARELTSLGTMAAGIMHEVNNPINIVLSAVYCLKEALGGSAADTREMVDDIEKELLRIRDIIADLRTFAHSRSAEAKGFCDVRRTMETAKRLLAHELSADVKLVENIDPAHTPYANGNQLVQLMVNLLRNALRATEGNPRLGKDRSIAVVTGLDDLHVLLSVRDNGCGIAEDVLPRIFDPFFTTSEVGRGMGLGLSICHGIVQRHGGEMSVKSVPGEFAEFVVKLPRKAPVEGRPASDLTMPA